MKSKFVKAIICALTSLMLCSFTNSSSNGTPSQDDFDKEVDNLDIISLSLCLVNIILFLIFISGEIKILRIDFSASAEKRSFRSTYQFPYVIHFIGMFVSLGIFILVIVSNTLGGKLEEHENILFYFLIGGFLLGTIVGEFYYHLIRKPFFEKNYPEEKEKYLAEARHWPRYYYLSRTFVENMIFPFFSLGISIGIVLCYTL